jgi:hypothetical protein
MRASGVGIRSAQIAVFPAIRVNVSAKAERRWTSLSTCLECSTGEEVSNERAAESELRELGSGPCSRAAAEEHSQIHTHAESVVVLAHADGRDKVRHPVVASVQSDRCSDVVPTDMGRLGQVN